MKLSHSLFLSTISWTCSLCSYSFGISDEWITDLTAEGIEPNPGPFWWKQINDKIKQMVGKDYHKVRHLLKELKHTVEKCNPAKPLIDNSDIEAYFKGTCDLKFKILEGLLCEAITNLKSKLEVSIENSH